MTSLASLGKHLFLTFSFPFMTDHIALFPSFPFSKFRVSSKVALSFPLLTPWPQGKGRYLLLAISLPEITPKTLFHFLFQEPRFGPKIN